GARQLHGKPQRPPRFPLHTLRLKNKNPISRPGFKILSSSSFSLRKHLAHGGFGTAHFVHLLHHLTHICKLLHEVVHLDNSSPRSSSKSFSSISIDDIWLLSLGWGHRPDDRFDRFE